LLWQLKDLVDTMEERGILADEVREHSDSESEGYSELTDPFYKGKVAKASLVV
jgi:hypothetical protein